MRFWVLLLFLFPAIILETGCVGVDSAVRPESDMYFKGYGYTSFAPDGFTRGAERSALEELRAQTASTWVALTVFEFQSSPASIDIAPNASGINPVTGRAWHATSSMDDLRTAVRDARVHGLKIMLKPQVDCYTGQWRGLIRPDTSGRWFHAYASMILRYAAFAEEEGIEMLCIGTELASATVPEYTSEWQSIIGKIRSVYHGMLTYSSNWSGVMSAEGEYEQIGFWRELDYLGVSGYFPASRPHADALPSESETERLLHLHGARLSAMASRWGRRVILTEAGCQSVSGALSNPAAYEPGASTGAKKDEAAQACYYSAILRYFGNRPWCAGIFWWNWESTQSATEATNYTCRNKAAARVLKRFYQTGQTEFFTGFEAPPPEPSQGS